MITTERVLALDISTKTGYSLIVSGPDGVFLEDWGQIAPIHMPDGQYPSSFVDWAYKCFAEVLTLVDQLAPDVLVIEETASGSKNIYSQKILEYIHFLVARMIKESGIKAVYLMTEEWRRIAGCKMTTEEKKRNKEVKDYKKKNNSRLARDKNNKIVGKVGRKHVNVRRANEIFGEFLPEPLRKKDEDLSDSLLLGFSYHLRRMKNV